MGREGGGVPKPSARNESTDSDGLRLHRAGQPQVQAQGVWSSPFSPARMGRPAHASSSAHNGLAVAAATQLRDGARICEGKRSCAVASQASPATRASGDAGSTLEARPGGQTPGRPAREARGAHRVPSARYPTASEHRSRSRQPPISSDESGPRLAVVTGSGPPSPVWVRASPAEALAPVIRWPSRPLIGPPANFPRGVARAFQVPSSRGSRQPYPPSRTSGSGTEKRYPADRDKAPTAWTR